MLSPVRDDAGRRFAQIPRAPIGKPHPSGARSLQMMSGRAVATHHQQHSLTGRRVESSAFTALLPAVAVAPVWLVAMFVVWLPVHALWSVSFVLFAGGYLVAGLFVRPLQVRLLARLLGARRPSRDERAVLDTSWRSVLQVNRLPRSRYVLAVLPADELNAFACGGHLVIVTSYAVETLPRDELTGVLAHELSHHLGFHTVALTISQWLSMPVLLLARIGFFLQNVATAATDTFARDSPSLTSLGRLLSGLLTAVSWVFLAGLGVSNALANLVGRNAEFQADRRVVAMGFGKPLASALRRVATTTPQMQTWRERVSTSHPPARTRVARIEALLRQARA
jgi:Zn-dependent protease with chaperone function